jgi:AcrR family transcriptional regulator
MGVHERREREHEAMREAILSAARDLFLKDGYEHASIRKIADRIEYSPAAIYRYFTGKEAIFFAIAETGFRLFNQAMQEVEPAGDPLETLRRRLWRYYEFSKTQPEYFALMFVDRSVPRISREWERFAFIRPTRERLRNVIRECIESGALPRSLDPDAVFHLLGAAMYGVAVLRLSDRFIPRQSADALAHDLLEATLAGLRQGVALTFTADICSHAGHALPPVVDAAVGSAPAVARTRVRATGAAARRPAQHRRPARAART